MRTNIVLDDQLVKEAFRYAKVHSKRELIDMALREYVQNRKCEDIRKLRGKVKIAKEYDYKVSRGGEV